jgi:hypothetical protein
MLRKARGLEKCRVNDYLDYGICAIQLSKRKANLTEIRLYSFPPLYFLINGYLNRDILLVFTKPPAEIR